MRSEGNNHQLLAECLRTMNRKRTVSDRDLGRRYLNFTSLEQSSGMGKSRTVDEASRILFTLPFNLRDPDESPYYPTSDSAVREFFVKRASDCITLRIRRYLQFFKHIFSAVADELNRMDKFDNLESLASAWREKVYDAEQIARQRIYSSAVESASADQEDTDDEAIESATTSLAVLLDVVDSKCIERSADRELRIVLCFDEAHFLIDIYVPNGKFGDISAYGTLCSTISDLQQFDLMGLFLSTGFKLVRPSIPKPASPGARGVGSTELQCPFVELPFRNPGAECITEGGSNTTLNFFSSVNNMMRLSRPLFKALIQFDRPGDIIKFAKRKLCNDESVFAGNSFTAAIASRVLVEFPLCHRNGPNMDRARETEAKLVASHMRVVYSIPKHREYMRSGYPSEPLLAEAAAQVMYEQPQETRNAFLDCLRNDFISERERGQSIVRYLSICGYDRARGWDGQGQFSDPIRLVDFLRALFGDTNYEHMKTSLAFNVVGEGVSFEEADAYVYFTHLVRAGDASVISDRCALTALSRGMAWQISSEEADIDIVISVAFLKSTDEPLDRSKITLLALRVKNRKEARSVSVEVDSFFTGKGDGRPYIVVVLELGCKPVVVDNNPYLRAEVKPRRAKESDATHHPCYFFTVYGCDSKSFGIIEDEEGHEFERLLNKDDLFNDHPRKGDFTEALRMMMPSWSADLCFIEGEDMDMD